MTRDREIPDNDYHLWIAPLSSNQYVDKHLTALCTP